MLAPLYADILLVLGGWLFFGASPMIRLLWPHLQSPATSTPPDEEPDA